jgi:F-type H+-transporting ATPase subunit alpha
MKDVAKSLRLDLAAFRELESFAQLGMDLDAATQRQLDRGQRMVRLLVQPQYQPMCTADQVIAIFSGARGFLDDLPVAAVSDFEAGLINYVKTGHRDFYDGLYRELKLGAEREKRLSDIITEYKELFKKDSVKK